MRNDAGDEFGKWEVLVVGVGDIFLLREQEKRCFYRIGSITMHIFIDGFTTRGRGVKKITIGIVQQVLWWKPRLHEIVSSEQHHLTKECIGA